MSFGLAAFGDLAGLAAAMQRADERMYAHKQSRRSAHPRNGTPRRVAVAGR